MSKNTNLSFLTDYITADITNGRIGINNASPAYSFDVTGIARTSTSTYLATASGNVGIGTTTPISETDHRSLTINASAIPRVDLLCGGTSTGIFFAASSLVSMGSVTAIPLYLQTSGATRLTITSAGNVGIGTTSPAYKLDIVGNTNITGTLNIQNASNIQWNGGDAGISNSSTDLIFKTYSGTTLNEKMRITSTGNVGIATTNPETVLQLGRVFGFFQDINSGYLTCNLKSNGNYIVSQFATRIHLDSALGEIKFSTAPSGSADTAATLTERMRITNAGNVGIGTTTPDTKLQVTATGSTGLSIRTDTSGDAFMRLYRDSTIYAHWYADRTNSKVTFGSVESVPLTFDTAATERMRITSAGNVGIGTSAPSSALDVNGIITGRNVIRYNAASTTSVSTTTTIISTASNTYGGLAMIWGNDASGNIFTDFIFYSLSAISVLSSQTISGGPSSRTYTTNGSGSLRLAMGSGTYTVRYQGLLV